MNDIYDIYPLNIVDVLFDEKIPNVYLQGVLHALATLTEREQKVLSLRYKDGFTLEKTAKALNITRERVRQIEAKAMRKMRHPSRIELMKAVPFAELHEAEKKYAALKEQHELLVRAFELINNKATTPEEVRTLAEGAVWMRTDISELDFSCRTYNCLKRAGKNTLKDLAEMTEEDLRSVRNLGHKSFDEVVYILKDQGLNLKGSQL